MAIDLVNNNDTIALFKTKYNSTAQKVGDTVLLVSGDSDVVEAINRIDSNSGDLLSSIDSNFAEFNAYEAATNDRIDSVDARFEAADTVLQNQVTELDALLSTDFPVRTGNFVMSANRKYLVDTSSAAITATFPANPAIGTVVGVVDYAGTFSDNYLTLSTSDGEDIQNLAENMSVDINWWRGNFEYIDSAVGWTFF